MHMFVYPCVHMCMCTCVYIDSIYLRTFLEMRVRVFVPPTEFLKFLFFIFCLKINRLLRIYKRKNKNASRQ